jgi:hypothetical protein
MLSNAKSASSGTEEIRKLENEIRALKQRNTAVELDKAWETGWIRKILIGVFTYLAIFIYMWGVKIDRPWLNAIVPTIGFLLSTLIMSYFKKLWIKSKKQTVDLDQK